jgi:fused signal recognition particle receptor
MSLFRFGSKKKVPEAKSPDPTQSKDLARKLAKTRSRFRDGLVNFFRIRKPLNEEMVEELETQLLAADVGVETTTRIIDKLSGGISRKEVNDSDALYRGLRRELLDVLAPCSRPLHIRQGDAPYVIMVVGVNGAGKTTTIGKLAQRLKLEGCSVMLAAGDTFRAAAVEQLQTWGDRNGIPVIAQSSGADSASVIFDALQSAKAKGIDVLIADTAGRLHTQSGLMDELRKVKRVIAKLDSDAPHEVMLVIDGGTGQNALTQAVQFNDAVQLTGMVVTKLDGTAKGGVMFAIADKLRLPIWFIGVGEGLHDLRTFDAEEFVEALLGLEQVAEE